MTSDFEETDEMEPFYLADCEAMTETQAELGQDWTEEAYMDRLAEKGFDPLTGKPLADLQAYKEQQREQRIIDRFRLCHTASGLQSGYLVGFICPNQQDPDFTVQAES